MSACAVEDVLCAPICVSAYVLASESDPEMSEAMLSIFVLSPGSRSPARTVVAAITESVFVVSLHVLDSGSKVCRVTSTEA